MSFKLHCGGVYSHLLCSGRCVQCSAHGWVTILRISALWTIPPACCAWPPCFPQTPRAQNSKADCWGSPRSWERKPCCPARSQVRLFVPLTKDTFHSFLYVCDRQCRLFRLYQSLCTTTCPAFHKNMDLYLNISFWSEECNYMKFWSSEIQISTEVKVVIAKDNKSLGAFLTDLCLCHNNLMIKWPNDQNLKIVIEKSWTLVQYYKVIEMSVVNSN